MQGKYKNPSGIESLYFYFAAKHIDTEEFWDQ